MSDVLVACFSRSGVTERLARRLATKLGADLDSIVPTISYRGGIGFAKGILHTIVRHEPGVMFNRDPALYSVVLLGSPTWAGRLSAPARSFLKITGSRIKTLATFTVSGGGGSYSEAISSDVQRLIGRPPLAMATFAAREVPTAEAEAKLDALVEALKSRTQQSPPIKLAS